MNVSDMLGESIEKLRQLIDVDCVVGKPIVSDGATILPISKLSVGFVSGGGEIKAEKQKPFADNSPLGVIGGGMTVSPLGFLVSSDDDVYFIKTQGDNVNKWLDIVQSTIKKVTK